MSDEPENTGSLDLIRADFYALRNSWRGQQVAYSSRPLTAALCYDRVVVPIVALDPRHSWPAWKKHFQYGMWLGPEQFAERRVLLSGFRLGKNQGILEIAAIAHSASLSREQAMEVEEWTGASVIPVFDERTDYELILKKGSREVVVTSLVKLDVVDEDELSLTQVLEFRRDRDAAVKYRRMLSWPSKELAEMSEAGLIETLERKLDDYTWALKKHGIKTTLGVISETLDGRYLLGVSGVSAALAVAGFPVLGLLAGAGVAVGKVGVRVATDWLELKDRARGENSEIAWLYETKQRFG